MTDDFMAALLVLELLRDEVDTTPDETDTVREAHAIAQEYRDDVNELL